MRPLLRTSRLVLALCALSGAAAARGAESAPRESTVTLPAATYERLLDRATRPPKRPELAPEAATLTSAHIRARVAGDTVRGTIELAGEVLREGPVEVPLVREATLVEARSGATPLALKLRDATHSVLLSHGGPFTLTLEFVAPVLPLPGRAVVILPAVLAQAVALQCEIPQIQAETRLEGGLVTRRSAGQDGTVIEAALDSGTPPRLSWSAADVATPTTEREARWIAHVRTLATVQEIDLRLAVLVDVTVVAGAPQTLSLVAPAGLELVSATGPSLESSRVTEGRITLRLGERERQRHQFLLTLTRPTEGDWRAVDVPLLAVEGAQRETGELAVEAVGTLELGTHESGTARRMDVRELSGALRGLANQPILAAFRYHRRPTDAPHLTLEARRFPDAPVPTAVADRAVVTTLLTTEGRSLTEVTLTVRNHAQPYLRVALPEGASLLTAEVEQQMVKPVLGQGGARVPLLRQGFRPSGPYSVSFTYLTPGAPLGKQGETRLALARMDLPVSMLQWEVFVPEVYKARSVAGEALPTIVVGEFYPTPTPEQIESLSVMGRNPADLVRILPGIVAPGSPGITMDGANLKDVGSNTAGETSFVPREVAREESTSPSSNVVNLQRRAAGVLPVQVDVPRAGRAFRFLRPLVLDEETSVTLRYQRTRGK